MAEETIKPTPVRLLTAIFFVCAFWLACIAWLHHGNSRLLPSWHGFLHSAIAARFEQGTLPPENPFFAGEPLPYYWFYHYCGYLLSRIATIDLLHAFQIIAIFSLFLLVLFSGLIGYKHRGSIAAGLLIGYLALVGLNPFGPLIALAKHSIRGVPLTDGRLSETRVESVFVTNRMADDLMTQPFLPALYVSSDWRNGQNIVWFLDISSRAPALGLVPVLFFLLLRKRPIASGVVSAVLTALSPVIGWALAASIALASLKRRPFPYRYLAPLAGAVLAMPSYYHILLLHSGSLSLTSSVSYALLKAVAITSNFVILLPLAIAGSRDMDLRTITIAGMLLLVAFPFVVLAPSNEHNLANLSQCMLAIPAGAAFLPRRKGLAAAVFLLFLPITVCTLWSFSGRPQLPLRFEEKTMHRIPGGHPLEQLYLWIEENTPREAVFVIDPDRPVKMSGNVSELPAFTSRALFVDQESYLTSPHRDARVRTELARCAVKGLVLTPEQVRYLQHLRRPLYLIAQGKVDQQYGNPVFISGPFAVFQLK